MLSQVFRDVKNTVIYDVFGSFSQISEIGNCKNIVKHGVLGVWKPQNIVFYDVFSVSFWHGAK